MTDCGSNNFAQGCMDARLRFKNPAVRRYLLRLVIAQVIYGVAFFPMKYILNHIHQTPQWIHFLTFSQWNYFMTFWLPTFPIAFIVITGLYLKEESDEYWGKLLQRAMLCSIGVTLAFSSVWGALEIQEHIRHFPLFWLFDMFVFIFAVFSTIFQIQNRKCDE
ncbi:MAG TPA: hypothetical protein VMQ60_08715 [Acidobacteriaceae bacterium]|jgi:hypothetical protein|nr:hypothetical protein [Acidobacteriaceae bacterium]